MIAHVPYNMRVYLMRLRYPEWNGQQAITRYLPQILYHTPLETGVGEPPSLASILLDWDNPSNARRPDNQSSIFRHARTFRNAPKEIINVVFSRSSPLPRLEWGDVIEFTTRDWESVDGRANYAAGPWHYDGDFKDLLVSKRFLNVTIVDDGKTHKLVLLGGLKVYDPRLDEAPLVPLNHLAGLLGVHKGAAVRVDRRDQGGFFDVVLGNSGDEIELEDGDSLTVTSEEGLFGGASRLDRLTCCSGVRWLKKGLLRRCCRLSRRSIDPFHRRTFPIMYSN